MFEVGQKVVATTQLDIVNGSVEKGQEGEVLHFLKGKTNSRDYYQVVFGDTQVMLPAEMADSMVEAIEPILKPQEEVVPQDVEGGEPTDGNDI